MTWSNGIDDFEKRVGVLATAQDRELALSYNLAALDAASQMHQMPAAASARHVQAHALQAEQTALTGRFRWMVIAMAIGFLIVINGSILLMMRAAGMILRPVARLVHASRELANENFAHRVTVGQHDEFDELARAYNHLAEKLQENERLPGPDPPADGADPQPRIEQRDRDDRTAVDAAAAAVGPRRGVGERTWGRSTTTSRGWPR